MNQNIKWYVCLSLIFINTINSYAQPHKIYTFKIHSDMDCALALESFKKEFKTLVAYDPTLSSHKIHTFRILQSETQDQLFEKLCQVYQLQFIKSAPSSYLVRSDLTEVNTTEDIILHINIEDYQGGQPVSFASVYDDTRRFFTYTDNQGDGFLRLPKTMKGQKLTVHSLAHRDQVVTIDPDMTFLQVRLHIDPIKVMPVTINTLKSQLSFTRLQGIIVDNAIIQKLSGSSLFSRDVMRSIQLLPGITATNDTKSSIRIRGTNEEGTLMMIDNLPVYKADHFYGIFGAFNSGYIKELTVYKNNIPVEFGGRTSGMVKLGSDPFPNQFRLNFEINLLNSGLVMDLPLSKNLFFKTSVRQTYTNLLNSKLYDLSQRDNIANNEVPQITNSLIISKPTFDFFDLNTRLIYSKGKHFFDLNTFTSKDNFVDQYNISFQGKLATINEELFKQVSKWQNKAAGFNYIYTGEKSTIEFSTYSTVYDCNYDISSKLRRSQSGSVVLDTVTILNNNTISDLGAKISLKLKKLKNTQIGLEHIAHNNQLYIENDKNPVFEINKTGNESSLFAKHGFGSKTKLWVEPAIRTSHLHELNKTYVLPQVYASLAVSPDFLLKSSFGRQVQYIRSFEHENLLGQKQQFFALSNDSSVPVGRAQNLMAGCWTSRQWFTLDVETYYRTIDGTIIHATQSPGLRPVKEGPNPMPPMFKLFTGQTRVYGVDFSLLYDEKNVFSMFNLSISKSENRFREIFKNQYFPSSEDSRFQFKWINSITAGKYDFSVNYIAATGRPYLDLSSLSNQIDRRNLNINNYLKKLSSYHRVDIGAGYKFILLKQNARIGFSVFNLTNRNNVKYRQFVYQLQGGSPQNPINTVLGSDVTQLDRTYNISFNLSIQR